jgi:hypothetical protein
MQRRNFKDAMNEMCDHTVAKIQEHAETLSRLDKEEKGGLLKFGGVEMNTDFPRTILYAILHQLLEDFKPRNDKYKDTMNRVLKALEIKKTPDTFEISLDDKVTDYKTQKEIAKRTLDESLKKK